MKDTTKQACRDCGATVGTEHKADCDIQRCSVCRGQKVTCHCQGHDPSQTAWQGSWPEPGSRQINDPQTVNKRLAHLQAALGYSTIAEMIDKQFGGDLHAVRRFAGSNHALRQTRHLVDSRLGQSVAL